MKEKYFNGRDLKLVGIIVVAIISIIILFLFIANGPKNKAIELEEAVSTAKSDITIVEKKRNEVIPALVECVKEYDKHEYETLMAVINARGTNSDETITELNKTIDIVVEAYPEIKSNENYKQLMESLELNENSIARYRENYNQLVEQYNSYVRKFPNSFFLNMTNYEIIHYEKLSYEVEDSLPTNLFN